MNSLTLRFSAAACAAALALGVALPGRATEPSTPILHLNAADGALLELPFAGGRALASDRGGFSLYDATAKQAVALPAGAIEADGDAVTYTAGNAEVRLTAKFARSGDHWIVRGEIENLRRDARGFIVDYRVPALSADAVVDNDLGQPLRLAAGGEREGNVFPIGAMTDAQGGIGLAIPPTEPRVFGVVGDAGGLALRFYLGSSPETRNFPNRASFVFILYPVAPASGFRGALSAYYGYYPDYYVPRLRHPGLFMFQMGDRMPHNIGQYGFDLVETQWEPRILNSALARDEEHGIASIPYMIVGQREIKFLDTLPKGYDQAMAAFKSWTLADLGGRMLTKENAASDGDIHLKEEVETSSCAGPDGRYAMVLRNTLWGGNSVTFITNPNPDLYSDQHRRSVGGDALALVKRWLGEHPEYDGMFVDSLGANWPAVLNYRTDHFAYAHYPLTFDYEGRVALQNTISHYEYIAALRKEMRASGRLVLANGVYAYDSRPMPGKGSDEMTFNTKFNEYISSRSLPEHYHPGARVGRFFCTALLDMASSEFGVNATVQQCQEVRAFMGRKTYAFLNYHWEDRAKVEEFVNKCLAYGIFASTSTDFFKGTEYEDSPDGYFRDRRLLNWYVPLVREMFTAGWEPVRHAVIEGKDVTGERFGHGERIYFTLYNDSTEAQSCHVKIDLEAIGCSADSVITEIGRNTALQAAAPGEYTLELQPKKTYVLLVSPVSIRP